MPFETTLEEAVGLMGKKIEDCLECSQDTAYERQIDEVGAVRNRFY